jgi:hypothetical protein
MSNGDGADGSSGGSWVSGLFDSAFDSARDAVTDLVTELSSITAFHKRVDQLISDLKASDAGPGKVGREQLVRTQFGGGDGEWAEAAGLFTAYETVITELEKLSKLLSDSMEGMGIAVLAAHKGYQNIDLDIRDRMAAISAETTEHYGGAYDPGPPQRGGTGRDAAPTDQARSSGGSSGDSGGTI